MIEAYRVSWLARYLKELIESDLRLSNLWVEGEISNLSRSSAGHVYFTLKDEERAAALRHVPRASTGGTPLENGAQVLAHGNVSFYESAATSSSSSTSCSRPASAPGRPSSSA